MHVKQTQNPMDQTYSREQNIHMNYKTIKNSDHAKVVHTQIHTKQSVLCDKSLNLHLDFVEKIQLPELTVIQICFYQFMNTKITGF